MNPVNNRPVTINFTAELTAFQGAIISADNVNRFSHITSRGGNEEKIDQIINRIYTFLKEKQYLTNDGNVVESAKKQLRKFTLYLILNSDVPFLEQLQEAPGIDMIIWTIPVLPTCLLCEFIWGLKLDPFILDVLVYCNPKLSTEVLPPLIDSIRHFSPTESLSKIKLLSYACYKLICRLHFYNYDPVFVTDLYEDFLRCITYFVAPPNANRLIGLGDDDNYKFMAVRLLTMVGLMDDCIQIFKSIDKFESEGFDEVFLCTMKPNFIEKTEFDDRVCNIEDGTISECLHKCNAALLDKCVTIMMEVSVDIFCAWSEFEENGRTLQSCIGEACYYLHQKLDRISSVLDHPILEMLPQISIKPKDVYDIMKASDDDACVENIDSDTDNKEKWITFVLQKDDLCQKMDFYLGVLMENSGYIEDENCKILIKKLCICIENNPKENYKVFAVDLFKQCADTTREEILATHFENKTFTNILETKNLSNIINQMFNKFIVTHTTDMDDILNVFIQNPFKTFVKIINVAVENAPQCSLMLKIMNMLKKYSDHFYLSETESCVINCLQRYTQTNLNTDLQRKNFVNFLIELKKLGILSVVKLLLLIIMPNLDKAVTKRDYDLVTIQIQLINNAFSLEEIAPYRIPILAMLAQVMEVVRWKLTTYTGKAPTVLEDTLQLQMKMLNSFNTSITEKDYNWLKSKVHGISSINMYYYKMFWNPTRVNNFIDYICQRRRVKTENLIVLLSKVISIATLREYSMAWESLSYHGDQKVCHLFYDAYAVLIIAETPFRTDKSRGCLIYVLRNLVCLTKAKINSEPLTAANASLILQKLVKVVNLYNEDDIEEVTIAALPLLSHIKEKIERNCMISGREWAKKIKHLRFASMILELFPYVSETQ